jgi:hypothetical protein
VNSLATGSTPELRVVASAFSREGTSMQPAVRSELVMPASLQSGSDHAFIQRSVEALARYSSSHMDESPTPWQEGFQPLAHDRDARIISVSMTMVPGATEQDVMGGVHTLEAHTGFAWSDPTQHNSAQSLQSIGETSTISIVRTLARVANPVLEMADGLRALRMNQIRVGDGLTLKLDGRTGRHARCFAILTQRF